MQKWKPETTLKNGAKLKSLMSREIKMKTIKTISMSLLFGFILIGSTNVYGQDPLKVAQNAYKRVVLENENVRVLDFEFAPGETIPWHTHPNHVIYSFTDGKIEITDKGKSAVVIEIKPGNAIYIPAVTHMARNIGTTTVKLIIVEMK